MRSTFSLLLFVCSCGATSPPPTEPAFIALQQDFAPFLTWPRTLLGESDAAGFTGPMGGYVKEPPDVGHYPVGAIIVKTIESPGPMSGWSAFAMAKRGGDFNYAGAAGWEYFVLVLDDAGTPSISSRGANPSDGSGAAHGYPSIDGNTCNYCHAADGTAATDHILSPALAPPTR